MSRRSLIANVIPLISKHLTQAAAAGIADCRLLVNDPGRPNPGRDLEACSRIASVFSTDPGSGPVSRMADCLVDVASGPISPKRPPDRRADNNRLSITINWVHLLTRGFGAMNEVEAAKTLRGRATRDRPRDSIRSHRSATGRSAERLITDMSFLPPSLSFKTPTDCSASVLIHFFKGQPSLLPGLTKLNHIGGNRPTSFCLLHGVPFFDGVVVANFRSTQTLVRLTNYICDEYMQCR